jgi:hypothetical protein
MKRLIGILMGAAALLLSAQGIHAQDQLVPAGTLLQCTLDEPNFSSATAAIGDPVLCHLKTTQEFGRPMFPRGSMLGGHLEADKEPGHFVGKGYLKITFDRVILPNGDLPLPAKVIQARGYKVDKQGAIDGNGHAERDVVEWMLPPLWPWKVISLPFRGPRPTLKGEEPLELRLMDDIVIPHTLAQLPHLDRPPYARQSSYNAAPQSASPSQSNMPSSSAMQTNAMQLAIATSIGNSNVTAANPSLTVLENARTNPVPPTLQLSTQQPGELQNGEHLIMLVLNSNQMIEVTKYYRDGDLMIITDTHGRTGSIEMSNVDWLKTAEMTGQLRSVDTPLLRRQLN